MTVPVPAGLATGPMADVLGGAPVQVTPEGLRFEVPPLYGRVLMRP